MDYRKLELREQAFYPSIKGSASVFGQRENKCAFSLSNRMAEVNYLLKIGRISKFNFFAVKVLGCCIVTCQLTVPFCGRKASNQLYQTFSELIFNGI